MRNGLLLIMVVLCCSHLLNAQKIVQDENELSLAMGGAYARSGLYLLLSGNAAIKDNLDMRIALGANLRLLNFGTLSPIAALDFSYDFWNKKQYVFLGPSIRGQLTAVRLANDNNLNTVEGLAGYKFSVGNKFRLTQSSYFGYGNERSNFTDVTYFSYLIQLGFGYNFK
jgi:hypothetical protein